MGWKDTYVWPMWSWVQVRVQSFVAITGTVIYYT